MKRISLLIIFLLYGVAVSSAYAGKDPIAWSLSPKTGFPARTVKGNSYSVIYTITNNLPAPTTITTSLLHTSNKATIDNQCINKQLSKNGTCQIAIGLLPAQTGKHTEKVTIIHGRNVINLPLLSTEAISGETAQGIDGFVTQPLPPKAQTGNSYPITFTFRNNGTSNVTPTTVNVVGFTATTNTCAATTLPAPGTCIVSGTYTPPSAGQKTLTVIYRYTSGGAKSVPVTTTTQVLSGGGSCAQVSGLNVLPLPTSTLIYSDNVAKFTFTNNCAAGSQVLGTVNLIAKLNGSVVNQFRTMGSATGLNDTCSGATLAPNAQCSVYVSVIPTAIGATLSLEANVSYANGVNVASAVSSEQVTAIPNQTTKHNLTFVNQCNQPVWIEFLNGNGGAASTGVNSPDPMAGSSPQAYRVMNSIGDAPTTKTISFIRYENGKIAARTGCDESNMVCKTASCQTLSGKGTCTVGAGPGAPNTAMEAFITNTKNADGVYDVSIINGMNVPAEMKGLGPVSSSDPYHCTAAGAPIQPPSSFTPPLGACPWMFTPPTGGIDATENYVFVSAGSQVACTTSGGQCAQTDADMCGTGWNSDINTGAGTPINRRCGAFQGYWTVADYIGYKLPGQWGAGYDLYTLYGIGDELDPVTHVYGNSTANPGYATYYDLYGCVPTSNDSLDSGYDSGKSRVCGCYDWDQAGSPALTNVVQKCCTSTNTTACTNQTSVVDAPNPLWQSTVFDRINWLKAGCPTAYSYQFDDKASQFTCNQADTFASYQIVFCPAGKTGSPNG